MFLSALNVSKIIFVKKKNIKHVPDSISILNELETMSLWYWLWESWG